MDDFPDHRTGRTAARRDRRARLSLPAPRHGAGWTFLVEAARDIRTVGAVAPSGRALARALTAPAGAHGSRPLTVLEAGAGTGTVTRDLVARLSPGSGLDVVEANPRFADRLRRLDLVPPHPAGTAPERLRDGGRAEVRDGDGTLARDGVRTGAGDGVRIRVHQGRVEEFAPGRRYDVIVSGLPLTNFDPGLVETIMQRYMDLLRPGGVLTYFAYVGTRRARAMFATRAETSRHRAVDAVMDAYRRRYATGCRTVWPNLPPARVWRLERPVVPVPVRVPAARPAGAADLPASRSLGPSTSRLTGLPADDAR